MILLLSFRLRPRDLVQGILAEGPLCPVCYGRQSQSRFVTHQQLLFTNRTLSEKKDPFALDTEGHDALPMVACSSVAEVFHQSHFD